MLKDITRNRLVAFWFAAVAVIIGSVVTMGVNVSVSTTALLLTLSLGSQLLKVATRTDFQVSPRDRVWVRPEEGAMRLLDKAGAPLKGLKIKLSP